MSCVCKGPKFRVDKGLFLIATHAQIHFEDASEFGLSTWTLCMYMVTSFVVNDFVYFGGFYVPLEIFFTHEETPPLPVKTLKF